MSDHLKFANHPLMYLVSGIGIALVLIQGTYILKKAMKATKELNMDQQRVKKGLRVAAMASIGPALGIVGSILSLIVSLGAPVSALRMSIIGGTNYETMAATFGAQAAGGELSPMMDPTVYANALWTPALGVIPWLIVTFFFGHRMNMINDFMTGGKKALLPAVSVGAMLGSFAYFVMNNVVKINVNPSYAVASLSALVIMIICQKLSDQYEWLKSWSLTIAMFAGALCGMFFV
ncbi:DUF5058 family protein [Facklamia sp. P12950]|uniref:DUF5058 family protein n=1 Tax=unclassified Facklamia TaxID=2622293 RepID=UPI003D1698E2